MPRPSGSISLRTPVDVSACTTAMMAGEGWAARSRSGSIGSPHSASTLDDAGAETTGHVAHSLAEHAVDPDHDGIAGPDEVHEGSLHARRPGSADRQRQGVGGGEDLAQAVVGVVENGGTAGRGARAPARPAPSSLPGMDSKVPVP